MSTFIAYQAEPGKKERVCKPTKVVEGNSFGGVKSEATGQTGVDELEGWLLDRRWGRHEEMEYVCGGGSRPPA